MNAFTTFSTSLLSTILITAPASAGDAIDFAEDDFAEGTWTSTLVQGGLEGTSQVTPIAEGGDPAAWLEIRHTLPAGSPPEDWCASWVWTFVWVGGAVVDPGELGGIDAIDWTIAGLPVDSENSQAVQSQAMALRQDGILYIGGGSATTEVSGWTTWTVVDLVAEDFSGVTSIQPCEFSSPDLRPDFSPGGSPIELGFARGNSTTVGGNPEAAMIAVGADAWGATVHPADAGVPGDVNGDGIVDIGDLLAVLAAWQSADPDADLDGDGVVGLGDLLAVLAGFGAP